MNEFKIYKDKLFPKLNGVDLKSLKIDYDCVSFITPHNDSKKIAEFAIKHIKKYKSNPKTITVVDSTACVGGDSIMLCHKFGNVISIEIDSNRYNNLVFNLNQYKFKNVEIINGDSTKIIPTLPVIDIIFIDVPWGGKDYKTKENLRFDFGKTNLEQFIINCFDNKITKSKPELIISKMPKNYDMKYLLDILSNDFVVTLYELKKMNIIAVEKKEYIKEQLMKDIKKISTTIVNEIINNSIKKIISNDNQSYQLDQVNKSQMNQVDKSNQLIDRQEWDSSDDFCVDSPSKKTNILI